MTDYPLISVITPSLNRVRLIGDAVDSVLQQRYPNYEHIVVDGGSTDGTLDSLKRYPYLRVISGPDNGMYDAINKGLACATGDLIGLLNTDDLYAADAFTRVARCCRANPGVTAIFGDATTFDGDGMSAEKSLGRVANGRGNRFDFGAFDTGFQINACFLARSVYQAIGGYDPRYRIVGDLDFLLRLAVYAPPSAHTGSVLYHLRMHPGSLTFGGSMGGLQRRLAEEIDLWRAALARPDLPAPGRRYCRRGCGNACFTLMAWHAGQGEWTEASRWARAGWRLAPGQMTQRLWEWAGIRLQRATGGR